MSKVCSGDLLTDATEHGFEPKHSFVVSTYSRFTNEQSPRPSDPVCTFTQEYNRSNHKEIFNISLSLSWFTVQLAKLLHARRTNIALYTYLQWHSKLYLWSDIYSNSARFGVLACISYVGSYVSMRIRASQESASFMKPQIMWRSRLLPFPLVFSLK